MPRNRAAAVAVFDPMQSDNVARPKDRVPWHGRAGGWLGPAALASAASLAAAALCNYRQAVNAERRLPPVGRFFEIDGVRLHYVAHGEGRPVVLLHGLFSMADEMMSSGLVERMAHANRVIIFDRPGYGYSTRPRDRLWTPAAQADLLRRAFRALGLQRPIVIGHSWGASVALALALDHPESVEALVLLAGYYYPTPRRETPAVLPFAVPLLGDLLRYTVSPLLGRLMAERLIAKMFAPRPVPARFASEYPLALALRPWQLRATDHDAAMMVAAAASMRHRYADIRHRVIIMAGTDDQLVHTGRHSARLHHEIARSRLLVYPDVGHMIHHAVPDAVARAVAGLRADGRPRTRRDWMSEYQAGPDGVVPQDVLVDEAMADSFPASDPPAYTSRLHPGGPAH